MNGRSAIVSRLGIGPSVGDIVRAELDAAFEAAGTTGDGIAVLDAGCGRVSALRSYRLRIARFVGADVHVPLPGTLLHFDEFAEVDLCVDADAFPADSFDVILSSFTVEHFADPVAAIRNMSGWLRPGGRLVITTINVGHPFVRAYRALPAALRGRLQRVIKESPADAHPIVAACNTATDLRAALTGAGLTDIRMEMAGHLARAWARWWPTWLLGVAGDLVAQEIPSRRSTIVASASAPR